MLELSTEYLRHRTEREIEKRFPRRYQQSVAFEKWLLRVVSKIVLISIIAFNIELVDMPTQKTGLPQELRLAAI